MSTVHAYAAPSETDPLGPTTIERRELGGKDVRIDIKYCGVCHSDIHTVRGDWGKQQYPLVPGHEIVGIVAEVGDDVTRHAVGDRVGVGCMVDSCRKCEPCQAGLEQYCIPGNTLTYASPDPHGDGITQGGYSQGIVVVEDFVVSVPDGIELPQAAPLLCAGITTYSPLRHWGAGPGKRVAVIGLGGLGHMAVKLAAAMDAEVTVISRTLDKQDDGLRLGAKAYYATDDKSTFKTLAGSFDLIINTVSAELPMAKFLSLLALDGTLVNVGAPAEPLPVQAFSLIGMRRSFAGSSIGGIAETQEMLDFCAEHGIGADIEMIDGSAINDAWERVLDSDVRYRFVIDAATLA